MTAEKMIRKIVKREVKRARNPEVYTRNRTEYLYQVLQCEGMTGLFDRYIKVLH